MADDVFEIFLATVPGLEPVLIEETRERGFQRASITEGGVTVRGGWKDVWRANLELRGASRVLVRLGSFKVQHLAKLDKLARKFPWDETLRADVPVRVETTCKKSRIYHSDAASERIAKAIEEELGAPLSGDAPVSIRARIVDDICTISVDTSGELLHKRGYKEAVNKAPLRETLAALALWKCGFRGDEPVVDPMCGSGTFILEAAEIAAGLQAGRARAFAFEHLTTFDKAGFEGLKRCSSPAEGHSQFFGFDRDSGATRISAENAERAGVQAITEFAQQPISALTAPTDAKGLVMINPPYGTRIGDVKKLKPLYQTLGNRLMAEFSGWRVGLITNSDELAQTTGLKFKKKKVSFSHGGIRVKLFQTDTLS